MVKLGLRRGSARAGETGRADGGAATAGAAAIVPIDTKGEGRTACPEDTTDGGNTARIGGGAAGRGGAAGAAVGASARTVTGGGNSRLGSGMGLGLWGTTAGAATEGLAGWAGAVIA